MEKKKKSLGLAEVFQTFPSILLARGQRSKPLGPDINGVFYLTWKLERCAGNDVAVELTRRCCSAFSPRIFFFWRRTAKLRCLNREISHQHLQNKSLPELNDKVLFCGGQSSLWPLYANLVMTEKHDTRVRT